MKSILIAATAVGAAIAGLILYGGKKKEQKNPDNRPSGNALLNGSAPERNAIYNMG